MSEEPLVYIRETMTEAKRVYGPYTQAHAERIVRDRLGEYEIVTEGQDT